MKHEALVASLQRRRQHVHKALNVCLLEEQRLVANNFLKIRAFEFEHQVQSIVVDEYVLELQDARAYSK
jgi:hypothetical protein